MAVQTTSGIVLAITDGTIPTTLDGEVLTGYPSLTYVDVGEVTGVPEYGASFQVVTHDPLATGTTEKYKGQKNNGSTSLAMGHDATDAGQVLVKKANDGANQNVNCSFRVTYQDGSVDYFYGQVFSYTKGAGGANAIVSSTVQVELNSKVFEVAAP